MKKIYFLFAILLFFNWNINSQITGGFESCVNNGDPSNVDPWWYGCGGGTGCYFQCSDGQAHSGAWSGLIPGDQSTEAMLDLGNQIFGEWGLEFWMYIPSGKVAYWNLQGIIPVGAGEWIVGNVFFNQDNTNPGVGLIDDSALGEVNFNFPHDQWFKVVMNIDLNLGISVATWELNIDSEDVLPLGTPFTNEAGVAPQTLGGVSFFSISAENELYVDDILFINEFIDTTPAPTPFTDDMESYTDGEAIYEGWWTSGCGQDLGCALESTSTQAYSGDLSGLVPGDGTTDAILDLGNKINGTWGLEYWTYIQSDKEAFWGIKSCVPNCTEDWDIFTFFNQNLGSPGEGLVMNTMLGDISFSFPHDQWFKVIINVDLSDGMALGTWQYIINGIEVIPTGTPFRNSNNQIPASFGGINYFSISTNNEYYLDDFYYIEGVILGTNEENNVGFKIYPNPSKEFIYIQSDEPLKNSTIYNVLGKSIINTSKSTTINISSLAKGIYFVLVETENGSSTQKLVKN
jgi:hypothetical protein